MKLDKAQIRHLKSLAHPLKPVVLIGQKGLTESVLEEIERALHDHELIKIKLAALREEREQVADSIATNTQSHVVAITGGIAIMFRRNTKKPKVDLKGA